MGPILNFFQKNYLINFKEEKRVLNEFREKYGIERLWEILSTIDWPEKILKKNSILSTNRKKQQYFNESKAETSYSTNNTNKETETNKTVSLNQTMNNLNLKNMDLESTIQLFDKVYNLNDYL